MSRAKKIREKHGSVIAAAATRFVDHEAMSPERVLAWLEQFTDEDLPLAMQLLDNIRYYNGNDIRELAKTLLQTILTELDEPLYKQIAIVPLGGVGSGTGTVIRAITGVPSNGRWTVVQMLELVRTRGAGINAIVFVDDFSGSGKTIEKWWATVEPVVRPLDIQLVVGLLVLNYRAAPIIKSSVGSLVYAAELQKNDDVFDPTCGMFSAEQQQRLLRYADKTKCKPKYRRGFGDCGLILSFKHGCPNNSLPTLWYGDGGWVPLFMRRAI